MEREVTLLIDGQKVPMNPFTQEIVMNVILGIVGSLKKTDTKKTIEIKVGPEK